MRVVPVPVGHRRSGDRRLEEAGRFEQAARRHVTPVRPAVDPDPRPVDVRERGEVPGPCDLVLHFDRPEVMIERRLERLAAALRAPVVEPEDDVPLSVRYWTLRSWVISQESCTI